MTERPYHGSVEMEALRRARQLVELHRLGWRVELVRSGHAIGCRGYALLFADPQSGALVQRFWALHAPEVVALAWSIRHAIARPVC